MMPSQDEIKAELATLIRDWPPVRGPDTHGGYSTRLAQTILDKYVVIPIAELDNWLSAPMQEEN